MYYAQPVRMKLEYDSALQLAELSVHYRLCSALPLGECQCHRLDLGLGNQGIVPP